MPDIKDLLHSIRSKKYSDTIGSDQWNAFASQMRKQKGNACQMCRRGDVQLQVHHPFYDPNRELWEYSPSEVMVLCSGCHKALHEQLQLFRRVVFPKMNPQVFQILNGALAVALDQYEPLVFAHALAEFVSTPSMVERYAKAWGIPARQPVTHPLSPRGRDIMNDPLEIPDAIRKAAIAIEIWFKVNGIEEWALMGIASRNQIELLRAQLAECQAARARLCDPVVEPKNQDWT